jgi:hypothetical protein
LFLWNGFYFLRTLYVLDWKIAKKKKLNLTNCRMSYKVAATESFLKNFSHFRMQIIMLCVWSLVCRRRLIITQSIRTHTSNLSTDIKLIIFWFWWSGWSLVVRILMIPSCCGLSNIPTATITLILEIYVFLWEETN